MTNQPSRTRAINSTTAALLVIVVILAGSLAFVTTTPRAVTSTVTQTSTTLLTTTIANTTVTQTEAGTSSTSTRCIQTGLHGTLYVRVVADNTDQPISGANVTAIITDYCTPSFQTNLGLTNSTGYSTGLGWTGYFNVSVMYAGTNYAFPASTSGAVSLVTLSIPSGVAVEKSIACPGLGCINQTTTVTASSSPTSTVLGQGTLVRNGTTFDEVGLQLNTLNNGTTIFFRETTFTYIQKNYNMTVGAATFRVSFGAGSTETLTVIDTGAATATTSEVYTHHQDPRAGLGMNLGDSSKVFLLVSIPG